MQRHKNIDFSSSQKQEYLTSNFSAMIMQPHDNTKGCHKTTSWDFKRIKPISGADDHSHFQFLCGFSEIFVSRN